MRYRPNEDDDFSPSAGSDEPMRNKARRGEFTANEKEFRLEARRHAGRGFGSGSHRRRMVGLIHSAREEGLL